MRIKIISYIPIALAVLFAFFGYALKVSEPAQGFIPMCLAVLCIILARAKVIKVSKDNKLWLIYTILIFLSLFFSINISNSIRYIIMFCSLLIFKIIIDNLEVSTEKVKKIIIYIGLIHVFATILYLLIPNVIQMIALRILSTSSYIYNVNLFSHGMIAGIASEHGANAIFISIVLSIIIAKSITKPKLTNLILTIVCIIALLLTGKRGPLIANIIAFLIIFIKYNVHNKKIIKTFLIFCVFICILVGILNQIPATNIVFERYIESAENNELLTGREDFYNIQISSIKNHLLTGIGIRGVHELIGNNDGHNIYLQVFAELGIVGIIVLLSVLLTNYIKTLKAKSNESILTSLYFQTFFIIYGLSGNPMYLFTTLAIYFIITSQLFVKGDEKHEKNRNIDVS